MRFRLWFFMGLTAAGCLHGEKPVVEVFVPPATSYAMNLALLRARATASQIYAEIGVRVIWRPSPSRPPGCTKALAHRNIVVAFETAGRSRMGDLAQAFSNPYATAGPCVTLFIDRLQDGVRRNPESTGFLIGHVLAHEMGHVLEGIARHSIAGVMKPRWSLKELKNMETRPLSFSAEDTDLILMGLGSTAASREPPPVPPSEIRSR